MRPMPRKTTTATARAGGTGPQDRTSEFERAASPQRRRSEDRNDVGQHGDVDDQCRQSDTPDAHRCGKYDREPGIRRRSHDEHASNLLLPCPRDEKLRQQEDRLVHDRDEGKQSHHSGALFDLLADPCFDQLTRHEQQRQRQKQRRGGCAAEPGQQEPSLTVDLARTFVFGERRVEQPRADAAERVREAEELGRDRVERRSLRPEHDPDDDNVGRKDDCVRQVDEEVAPAERRQLANARASQVILLSVSPGSSERSQASGSTSRSSVVNSVKRTEQDQAATTRDQSRHEHRIEHGRDEVGRDSGGRSAVDRAAGC